MDASGELAIAVDTNAARPVWGANKALLIVNFVNSMMPSS